MTERFCDVARPPSLRQAGVRVRTETVQHRTPDGRFHEDGDRLYRVMRHVYSGDEIRTTDDVTFNIARVLEEDYPEVEDVAVETDPVNLVFRRGGVSVRERVPTERR